MPDCSICCVSDTQQNVKSASKFLFHPSWSLSRPHCGCITVIRYSRLRNCRSGAVGFEPTFHESKSCACAISAMPLCGQSIQSLPNNYLRSVRLSLFRVGNSFITSDCELFTALLVFHFQIRKRSYTIRGEGLGFISIFCAVSVS